MKPLHICTQFLFQQYIQKIKIGNNIEKVACSQYWKGKDSYQKLQDAFYKHITENGFELERGRAKGVEHISTEKLKQITNYDNIKYEINNNDIPPIQTENVSLILQQNQELIKQTHNLRLQLSKSYAAISKIEEIQKENCSLKQENKQLENENNRLRDYIDKTFEVAKHLFNFPISTFKRLVDNFVKNLEK